MNISFAIITVNLFAAADRVTAAPERKMIFGFNTDVRHGDTAYHVQSEPHDSERILDTQVFVGGRCIGKRATSYDDVFFQPGSIEDQLHELLREQHRMVVAAIREGRVNEVLAPSDRELAVHWLNTDSVFTDGAVVMRVKVTYGGEAVAGASLTSRVRTPEITPVYWQSVTDTAGTAEMRIPLPEHAMHDADVLVEAMHEGKSAVRKFRLRRSR